MKKILIFDSGPLISLALNGLLSTLEKLKEKFPEIEFVMTPQVKVETIDKALTIKKYELEAVKIQSLVDHKIMKMSTDFISAEKLSKETMRIMNLANTIVKSDGEYMKIVHVGEASCLAFSNLCNCKNIIAIDERVTRLLTESPENLQKIMERKLHRGVNLTKKNLSTFTNYKFIRSTELAYIAYKNNLYEYKKDKILLDALLYALKYSGTSISSKEIEEIKNLDK